MKERRKSRSDNYQYILLEQVFSHEMLEAFSNEESIYKRMNPFDYNEEIMELQEQLKKEFWRIIESDLTPRQKQIVKLYTDGYTQMEIAKMLNVNQSSITKSLNGNVDYRNGKVCYGGAKRKLKKIIENDKNIRYILDRISALRGDY